MVSSEAMILTVMNTSLAIDHFTAVSLVTWPMNESEAEGEFALIETSLLFYVNDAVLMLIRRNLLNKSSEVSIITRHLQPHFHSKAK